MGSRSGHHEPDPGDAGLDPGSASSTVWTPFSYSSRPANTINGAPSGESSSRAAAAPFAGREPLQIHAVRDHLDLVRRELEDPSDLLAHELRARDHPAGLEREPPLHLMDQDLDWPRQVTLVTPVLRRVHRGHQREGVEVLQRGRGVADQPVMGVQDVRRSVAQVGLGPVEEGDVEGEDPGDEVVERDPGRVLVGSDHPNAGIVLFGRGVGVAAGVHGDVVAVGHQAVGEVVDVAGESADDRGRVFPRQQGDGQGRGHGSSSEGSGVAPARDTR